ncbi:MAG TPA: glycosyltransferase family 2 protein [Sandaracinaceae bacterium LLY-WYZ-13_1]|nr:glycosyltransferase family 2 protein [Sandaracinaceae bacterium LLY-WYZ-13_1]
MSGCELSVIVFAFDEEENVGAVLGELRAWLEAHEPSAELVFVDDGSRDDTLGAAGRALDGFPHRTLRHETNRGIGAALKTGVRAARGDWVTFLPADGQIEPDAIGTLRTAAADDAVDVVLSVYDHRDDGLDRTLLSAGVRALIWAVHGVRLNSDGPYLMRRRLFVPDQLPPDSFFLNFELPIRALAAGLRTRTVTIACRPRRAGRSKSTGLWRIWGVARDLADLRRRRARHAWAIWRGR